MKRSDFIKTSGIGLFSGSLWNRFDKKEDRYKDLIKPKRLTPGDTIGITAPAGILYDVSEFDRMKRDLESLGLHVRFGEFVREQYGYFAGRDYQRALDLNRFFADPEIDGIIAVRGGWGCSRILPYLDFKRIRENPKVYCGFSDNTTLHLSFLAYSGLISYHGPNGSSDWNSFTKNNFKEVVMDGKQVTYPNKRPVKIIRPGIAEGRLIGGNLTILTTSLGTPYEPDPEGAILFIEDIAEPAYKIDRMLTHLARSGYLEKISGFIFGQCTDCDAKSGRGFTLAEVLKQHIHSLGVPAVLGLEVGHDTDNVTIPVGVRASLNADTGTLKLLEPGVQ